MDAHQYQIVCFGELQCEAVEKGNKQCRTPLENLREDAPAESLWTVVEGTDALALTDAIADSLEVGFCESAFVDDVENFRLGKVENILA
ncbi:MAG: hypothetical protein J6U53_03430 [Tidjanibacter sp.]|nr:hypothetical protein [Tidjanibacter sp.]